MISDIGKTAGEIYRYLDNEGEVTLSTLKKNLNLKADFTQHSKKYLIV